MGRKFQVLDWPAVRQALPQGHKPDKETIGNIRAAVNRFLMQPPPRMSDSIHSAAAQKDMQRAMGEMLAGATQKVMGASTSDDFPDTVLPVVRRFQQTDYYDDAWELIFDVMDFTSVRRNGFAITDIEDGLSFEVVPSGGKAKVYKVAGSKTTVTFDKYGAALGWDRQLLDDEEYWALDNAVVSFRNQWYADRSDIAYALIEALSSTYNVSWQSAVPASLASSDANYTAVRDIETINYACHAILDAVKGKGYGVSPQSSFVLLYPLSLMTRVRRALGLLNAGIAGDFQGVQYNVMPVATLGLSSSSYYYVALPKQKLQWGDRMNLTVFDEFDPGSYSDVQYGWGRYGGAIGDSNQVRRCALS
jgi:hypothetical protein